MSLAPQRAMHACAGPYSGRNSYLRPIELLRLFAFAACLAFAPSASAQTIDVRPAASKDDAEERADLSMYTGSSDLELTFDTSTQTVGIRWPAILIPQGATITSAWVQFQAKEAQSEQTDLVISGEASANALAFSTTAGNVSSRARVGATVAWSNLPAWTAGQTTGAQKTPELKNVIQLIVSQPLWASGNALVLIITGTGHRTATAWDGGAANAPLLHIEYTVGPPPPPANTAPTAVLSVSQNLGAALMVDASAAGSSDNDAWPIASYTFNWGDGSPNTVVSAPTQTASHTYAAAGPYTVTLTATDTGPLTSAPVTKNITVVANNAPTPVLNASQPATPFLTVDATAAGSSDTDPWPIASYTFVWGDGSAATTVSAPTQNASHTYASAGPYTITLTVKDTGNLTSAPATKSMTVNPPPPNGAPTAVLNVSQAGSPPLTVNASAVGSADSDPWPIASYTFNWGDGSPNSVVSAPTQTASHTYAAAGPYTVTLTATDTGNLASAPVTKGITLTSNSPPIAVLTAMVQSSPARTIQASGAGSTDTDAYPIASYTFAWGDGTANTTVTAPAWSATHSYASPGTYTVTLTAKDTGNLTSTPITKQVTVSNLVTPTMTFDARTASDGDDAEESSSGSVSITGGDLELIYDGNNQVVGVRFPNLNIYSGATITSAWIQFTADESQSEATILDIQAQNVANAPAFTTASQNVSSRTRTAAIAWAPDPWTTGQVGAAQKTPELKSIVQQVVSLPTWIPGNAVAFIFTGTGHRTAEAWQSGSPTISPLLHIEYTGGTPPANQPPTAVLNVNVVTSPPLAVNASAAGSTDTDSNPIASYTFSWGDGTANTTVNAPTQTAAHTYASAGTYTVTLTAKDTGNLTSSPVTRSVTVGSTSGPPIAVWASYYSTHHSYNIQPKPSPWWQSSNVVFVGTPDSPTGGWDSAGLRIDNLSGAPMTLTATVVIGTKTFNLWGARTIPAGQSLILAQTGYENFDGSDTNPAGCYDCDPSLCLTAVRSTVPVANITINGVTTKYYDTAQTMNTNGVDYAGCPKTAGRNDESRGWVRIYSSDPAQAPPVATNMYQGDPNNEQVGLTWLSAPFPNPVRDVLTMQFNIGKRGPVEMAVYDVAGRQVKSELSREFEPGQYQKMIPVHGMSAGIYYCTLRTAEGTLRQTFIVAK